MSKQWTIPRTVTHVEGSSPDGEDRIGQYEERAGLPFSDFRRASAVVLLGEPGMGKTTLFKAEASDTDGEFISARDFRALDASRPRGKVLFIDGLDEMRAGAADARVPFDEIRARLDKLGRPPFRISCREADWLLTDKDALKKVSNDGGVVVLRLDHLTDADIEKFLGRQEKQSITTSEFMNKAREHGVESLMRNPQLLTTLIAAVGTNWPRSKIDVLKGAVDRMAEEHNPEHASVKSVATLPERVQAAGFLCSQMMLADKLWFSLTEANSDQDCPPLNSLEYDNPDALQAVAKSKLFKQEESRVTYSHRSIAEYLCASYLNQRLEADGGPSLRRILALLTGKDGVPVRPLRGVYDWLATLSTKFRGELVRRDPLGVVLYGDVSQFTPGEIQSLLNHLKVSFAESDRDFIDMRGMERSFASMCVQGAKNHLLDVLHSQDRSRHHQMLAFCVLEAMRYGHGIEDISLWHATMMDSSWLPFVRSTALSLLMERASSEFLLNLLNDIDAGKIDDNDDEYCGRLLEKLYPCIISHRNVLNYLHKPKDEYLIGSYNNFWCDQLIKQSSDESIAVLLNQLVEGRVDCIEHESNLDVLNMTRCLISRALVILGDDIETSRLISWLSLGSKSSEIIEIFRYSDEAREIKKWFIAHPEIQKNIYIYCIEQHIENYRSGEDMNHALFRAEQLIGGSANLEDLEFCVLNELLPKLNVVHGKALLRVVYRSYASKLEANENFQQLLENKPSIKKMLDELKLEWQQHDQSNRERMFEHELKMEAIRKRNDAPRQELINKIRENIDAVENGTAATDIYYHLGTVYFGRRWMPVEGDTPRERLQFLLEDDGLVEIVLNGFKHCIKRSDLPSYSSVFEQKAADKVHNISYALAVGLEELSQECPDEIATLDDEILKSAVAVKLCILIDEQLQWHDMLLKFKPGLVAEVMIDYFRHFLAVGSSCLHQAGLLARNSQYGVVAKLATTPILEHFPLRPRKDQLATLASLLLSAWQHDPDNLPAFLEKKLKRKSMTAGQRVLWLTMGVLVSPELHLNQLDKLIDEKPKQVVELVSALQRWTSKTNLLDTLAEHVLQTLIRIIIRHDKRVKEPETARIGDSFDAEELVRTMIQALANKDTDDAAESFRQLLSDDSLEMWHLNISRASQDQLARRREKEFVHQGIEEVTAVLANRKASSAADIAAVTYEAILELADRIKNGNTNDYQQYWNTAGKSKKITPRSKTEDECRDAFLSDLKQQLNKFVLSAEPEGRYAQDKRSDIKVTLGGSDINIPIEIKLSHSPDLWSAIHSQLIAKYTRDPGTSGYGIFLVFWFGSVKKIPASGIKPQSAEQLCQQLQDSLQSSQERRLIQIAVIDCTSTKLTNSPD